MEDLVLKEPKFKEVSDRLKKGEIDIRKYFTEMYEIHQKKSRNSINKYNSMTEKIKKDLYEGIPCKKVVNWLLIIQSLCLIYIGQEYVKDVWNVSKKITPSETRKEKVKKAKKLKKSHQ